jgi:4''-phosphopantetheinyl transferase superfamily.
VDLKEPANAEKSRNSRFLKKILTDAEIEFVQNARNSDKALWSHWACKETAFKVIKKICPDTAFLPRRWKVFFKKSQSTYSDGEVIIPGKDRVYIRFFSNLQYVHCIGSDSIAALGKLIWSVDVLPEKEVINPSIFVRYCLGQDLAQHISLNFHDIKIKRTRKNGELTPPRVYVNGRKTDIDISLSHDGRFIAYVFNETRYARS